MDKLKLILFRPFASIINLWDVFVWFVLTLLVFGITALFPGNDTALLASIFAMAGACVISGAFSVIMERKLGFK